MCNPYFPNHTLVVSCYLFFFEIVSSNCIEVVNNGASAYLEKQKLLDHRYELLFCYTDFLARRDAFG